MKTLVEEWLNQAVERAYPKSQVAYEINQAPPKYGEYATNLALKLAGELKLAPLELADKLSKELAAIAGSALAKTTVSKPGFINLTLSQQALIDGLSQPTSKSFQGQTVLVEYSDPNPFKILHVGHVYTTVVGDALANLIEQAGAKAVVRLNYGGDVGLHVGKTIWAILKRLGGEKPTELSQIKPAERMGWISSAYVQGNQAYKDDLAAKEQIDHLNKQVYELQAKDDKTSNLGQIYFTCRQWSYDGFNDFYRRLGTKIDRYYAESEVAPAGLELVKKQIGPVFKESEGAVIYEGEKHGLHNRVFITSAGLPTYEAKELGLLVKKTDDYQPDKSIIVTGNEQEQYVAVVLKAASEFLPEAAQITSHVPHGMVRLAGGTKMSSRLGNIITADEVFEMTSSASQKAVGHAKDESVIGAIKYAFLKYRLGQDFVFDPAESVSLEGSSGPYLQYAHARACSILSKSSVKPEPTARDEIAPIERQLLFKLSQFSDVVDEAVAELKPSHICTYLYELAQEFNRFYEQQRVIGSDQEAWRLYLVSSYAAKLKLGLALLGIAAPDKM